MNSEFEPQSESFERPGSHVPWRVISASLFFLLLGLGAMWVFYLMKDRSAVGVEALDALPPVAPVEQVAPNRVRLFFTANGALLSSEIHDIGRSPTTYDRATAILNALLKGPRASNLRSPIPRGVKFRGLYIADTMMTVDFSSELRDGLRGGASAETLCVYSIVNSLLLNCQDLKTVTFLIEGQPIETLLGYLDLSGPLVENLALMAGEKSSSD